MVPLSRRAQLLQYNSLFANMLTVARFGNSDALLKTLIEEQQDLTKMLLCYSPHNRVDVPIRLLFERSPDVVSWWFSSLFSNSASYVLSEPYTWLQALLGDTELRLQYTEALNNPYFAVSYLTPEHEVSVRRRVNQACRKALKSVHIRNAPDFTKVLVVSRYWHPDHIAYKGLSAYIRDLGERYHLTLLDIGAGDTHQTDTTLFDEVLEVRSAQPGQPIPVEVLVAPLRRNEFGAVYFTEVGLTPESLLLSNLRIAPIQITGYGHPVSTHGSEIDYFIGGTEMEDPKAAEAYYSERLVLVPGFGWQPEYREFTPSAQSEENGKLHICCSWSLSKCTAPLMACLQRIVQRVSQPVVFHFIGMTVESLAYLVFKQEVEALLGKERVHVAPIYTFDAYMAEVARCDFAIDSWPFASYNRILDLMQAGLPVVTLSGQRMVSRCSSVLMRALGAGDLVAETVVQYEDHVVRMVEDASYRDIQRDKVQTADPQAVFFQDTHATCLRNALDVLVARHRDLKRSDDRSPLLIGQETL